MVGAMWKGTPVLGLLGACALLGMPAQAEAGASRGLELEPDFSGSVAGKACGVGRNVKVFDATTGQLIAKTRTNRKGRFSIPSAIFSGQGYGFAGPQTVRAKDGDPKPCRAARSPVVSLGSADLRLSLAAVERLPSDGGFAFSIAVTNIGPSIARNVVLRILAEDGFQGGSPQTCFSDTPSTANCSLGDMPPHTVSTASISVGPCSTFPPESIGLSARAVVVVPADPTPLGNSLTAAAMC